MKKNLPIVVIVFFVNLFFGSGVFAQTPPPTGTVAYYYCIGDTASQLTAGGTNLLWYTTATGGPSGSSIAPTPSTSTAGTTTYYVTQTVGGIESNPRKAITVNVDKQFSLICGPRTTSSVSFDFAHVGETSYNYSYTVDGGSPFSGILPGSAGNYTVNVLEGQSVTFTITAVGARSCVRNPTLTLTCRALCSSSGVTPTFTQIPPICEGDPSPTLPLISNEGFQGSWSPSAIDNMTTTTYTFTPTNTCINSQRMIIVVNPDSPGFSDFTICSGSTAPPLEPISPNGVAGTWNPATVDTMNSDSYTFTPDAGQCASPQTINVTVVPSNTLVDFSWTVTEAFAANQIITISADAPSDNYVYRLDDGPFQSSPVFEHVASGSHSVTVMDQEGCSAPITKSDIIVVNYPKYFTPNNDGYNDYWNITELSSQPYAYIRIFDRYGKLLKQISPNGAGWNGTFNGHYMPADDYWFVIHYSENNVIKEFKSHFSLKR